MNSNGEQKLYSANPPLHAVLVAAPYWLIEKTTGCTLESHRSSRCGADPAHSSQCHSSRLGWWWCARLIDEWTESDVVFAVSLGTIVFATMISSLL